jgi:hypothetical protein
MNALKATSIGVLLVLACVASLALATDTRKPGTAATPGGDEVRAAATDEVRAEASEAPTPLPTDCNGNGVPDDIDILGGTSQDCNSNAVPDECDVAAGTSEDCQPNGMPDECDLSRIPELYAVSGGWGSPPVLFTVNTGNGSLTPVAPLDQGMNLAAGLAAHPGTGEL